MKIIIFDDDPTGSQAVYGCPLLLSWDVDTIRKGLKHVSPLLFILTNTRSLSSEFAEIRLRDVCQSFKKACEIEGIKKGELLFVSRGDSTLRGHVYIECETINQELGCFDATFHIPAFLEGGRQTIQGKHFLNGVPVHLTPFAEDRIFGYSTNDLAIWLERRSGGIVSSSDVGLINIDLLNAAMESGSGMSSLLSYLLSLSHNKQVIVDAQTSSQLGIFANAVKHLRHEKNFLFRSAASLLKSLSSLPPQPKKVEEFSLLRKKFNSLNDKPGLILVGSHVKLADDQLKVLIQDTSVSAIELPVLKAYKILNDFPNPKILDEFEKDFIEKVNRVLISCKTPALYTTREEMAFDSTSDRIKFGIDLARIMARISAKFISQLGYIISKGGTTTQVLLSYGLGLPYVQLQGQILPGLSVVTAKRINQIRDFPILTFPGNLGDKYTLLNAYKHMENKRI